MKKLKKVLIANLVTLCITSLIYIGLYTGLRYYQATIYGLRSGFVIGSIICAFEWLAVFLLWIGQAFFKWLTE